MLPAEETFTFNLRFANTTPFKSSGTLTLTNFYLPLQAAKPWCFLVSNFIAANAFVLLFFPSEEVFKQKEKIV